MTQSRNTVGFKEEGDACGLGQCQELQEEAGLKPDCAGKRLRAGEEGKRLPGKWNHFRTPIGRTWKRLSREKESD